MTMRVLTTCFVATLGLGACADAIVGGECAPDFVACEGRCARLEDDPRHCGACGNDCGGGVCVDGRCASADGGSRDAGAMDAARATTDAAKDGEAATADAAGDAGGQRDAMLDKGPAGFPLDPMGPFGPDGGVDGCALGQSDCGADGCVPIASTATHCGGCGQACDADQFCVHGMCIDDCDPPLVLCGTQCFDVSNDPGHCGGCGRECISGICEDGVCADAVPGHVVVVGHDFVNRNTTMNRLVGNALFLARGAPVRTVVYEGGASSASVNGVANAIDVVVAETGRSWVPTSVAPEDIPAQLRQADALIIHAQLGTTDAMLAQLGEDWGVAMTQFLFRGGVIVLLETDDGTNGSTFRTLEPAGIFTAAGRERISAQRLRVVQSGLGIAVGLPSAYMGRTGTVRFLAPQTDAIVVVEDEDGEAVVLHRVVRLP